MNLEEGKMSVRINRTWSATKARASVATVGMLAAFLVMATSVAAAAVTPSHKTGAKFTFKMGFSAPLGNDQATAGQVFADEVRRLTKGKADVVLYPNSILGSEVSMLQQLQSGALEMAIISTAVTENVVPEISAFDVPFVIKNYLQAGKVFTGKPAQLANASLLTHGLRSLGWNYIGFRITDCKGKTITSPSYFQGIKIRVPNSPVFISIFQALGAHPDPIAFNDIYTSLQTGVVDCFESTGQSILNSKFYEVAKDITMTRHLFGAGAMMINNSVWNKLPKDIQAALVTAGRHSNAYARRSTLATENQSFQKLAALGVTFHTVDTTALQQVAAPLQGSIAASTHSTALLKAIKAVPSK
jgi:tripartite ATP-independent transporter DctP family solute receptor